MAQKENAKKRELGYNGWHSYETWLVNVWDYTNAMIENFYDQELKPDQINEDDCEGFFMDFVEGDIPRSGIIADMINGAISEIDWREIRDHVADGLQDRILDEF